MRRRLVGLAVALGVVAVVMGAAWFASDAPETPAVPMRSAALPPPIPPEHMPPPFEDRGVLLAEPGAPAVPDTASFCDERNWARVSESALRPTSDGDGVFRVDAGAWARALVGSQAGLASWMSKCRQDGGPVVIVAHLTGERLATYDPREGLRQP